MVVRYSLIAILATLSFACKDEGTPPPLYAPSIVLEAVDASCTEAWLKASTTATPVIVRLLRDNQHVSELRLLTADSLIVDDGLLPNHQYSYQLQKLGNDSNVVETTTSVQVQTMDTTSHEFTWHMDTLGVGFSNTLWDAAIINDTLAYAVGELHQRDSSGQIDPNAYNVAKWNGVEWQLLRLQFLDFCTGTSTYSYPARSVFAFATNNVWITSASQVVRWDGITQTFPTCITGSVNRLFGANPNSLYAVGDSGFVARYTGNTWQRIESGTTVTLNDAWGGNNRWVGDDVVLVAASNKYTAGEMKLLRLHNGVVDSFPWHMQDRRIQSVWFDGHSRVYTAGGGVFEYRGGSQWREITEVPLFYTNRIRGTGPNDIFVVGDFGVAAHFNGVSWRVYPEVQLQGNYESLTVLNDVILAVGWTGTRAIVLRGTRTPH